MTEIEGAGAPAPAGDEARPKQVRGGKAGAARGRGRGAGVASSRRAARKRPVRWSARRERLFLEMLAESSNIAKSARAAGVSDTTVYRRRNSDPAFRARWITALREGFVRLEADLLDRALNGTRKDVWHGGKKVGTVTEYSERLALALLAAHRGTVMGAEVAPLPPPEEMRTRLIQRLDEMGARLADAGEP